MRFAIFKAGRATERGRKELGDVHGMFKSLLAQPGDDWDVFEVLDGEFPEQLGVYDGIVITGSPKSTYDDLPWIRSLEEAIREAYQAQVPILGVCFGHQMVAQALGGKVVKNPKGWETGIREVQLTPEGQKLPLLSHTPQPLRILELHQDIVSVLPPGAVRLAYSNLTENEMFRLGNRVLCIQGHPEMDNEEVRQILTTRDWLPREVVESGLAALRETPHRDFLQWFMVQFLRFQDLDTASVEYSAAD